MRTLQTRTADMHDCQLDCQLGSVVQHRHAPDRTLSSHKQSPRYALRRNGAPPGGLPLSLLALSHQPVVTHSNYTCAMLASPAHHAPRLDASRRTPGALHPEPKFNVLGHFADGLLFYHPHTSHLHTPTNPPRKSLIVSRRIVLTPRRRGSPSTAGLVAHPSTFRPSRKVILMV